MTKRTHEDLMKIALNKPGVKKAYDSLEEEFELLDVLYQIHRMKFLLDI